MSRSYDRVERCQLEKIKQKLSFDDKLRALILKCVTSISYSFKINGKPRESVIPSRGIRQGDPLSPYLFLLCADGLSTLIKKAVDYGQMGGLVVCRNGPKLSHLFFADDSLIFCRASLEECNALQRVLLFYKSASGQQLNHAKTSLFFSSNRPRQIQEEIKDRFGAQFIKQYEKWLEINETLSMTLKKR